MIKITFFFAFFMSVGFVHTQTFKLLSNEEHETILSYDLELKPLKYKSINSKMYIDFDQMYEVTSLSKSAPRLPMMSTSIVLSPKGNPQLEVSFESYTDIPNMEVAPSKGNLKRNIDPASIPYEFGEVYQMNAFYPGKLAQLSAPFIARDIRAVTVTVFPYQYNPVTKVLRVYKDLKVKITANPTEIGQNELVNSNLGIQTKNMFRAMFLNGTGIEKYTPKEEVGDLLIICDAEMDSIVQILAKWKIQKGIKTKIVHTAETGIGVTNIKNYIFNYYNVNADFLFLLLIGDHADIPAHTYGEKDGEQLWSDSYYGQLAGTDLYPELFVGRFSGNQQEIATMVQRTIEYEKNPAGGNWMQKAIGLASADGSGFGLNGMADWEHMRDLRNDLLSSSYSEVHEFYDGSQGGNDAVGDPTTSLMKTTINNSVGLVNYAGHGDLNIFNTSIFSSTEVMSLNNQGQYPWVISVACNHGTFTNGTCISEQWLRASHNSSTTGAIAACGSTILMAWAQPMKTQKEMTGFITNSNPANSKKSLGGIFYNAQMKMMEQYPGIEGDEVMQTWVFFGDPTVEFRNQQTLMMDVSHVSQIEQTENSLTVNCNSENTLISISQENVFLGKGIVIGGAATIALPVLLTDMPLTVTGTKQNYRPYQAYIQVGNGPLGITNNTWELAYTVFPNPASNQVQVVFSSVSESTITILNSTGQILKMLKLASGSVNESISLAGFAKGIYQIIISNSETRSIEKLVIH